MCFVIVLCCFNKFVDHGGRWGYVVWTLAQWQHLVASHEATNVLHWLMCIALYHPGSTAIKIIVNLPAFLLSLILCLPTTYERPHYGYGQYEVKQSRHIVFSILLTCLYNRGAHCWWWMLLWPPFSMVGTPFSMVGKQYVKPMSSSRIKLTTQLF